MFQSHLDEQPIMTMSSGLGQEDQQLPAARHDVVIPQGAPAVNKYKPLITLLIVAGITYMILKSMKDKKVAPAITG